MLICALRRLYSIVGVLRPAVPDSAFASQSEPEAQQRAGGQHELCDGRQVGEVATVSNGCVGAIRDTSKQNTLHLLCSELDRCWETHRQRSLICTVTIWNPRPIQNSAYSDAITPHAFPIQFRVILYAIACLSV